jgi:hypothetical protein
MLSGLKILLVFFTIYPFLSGVLHSQQINTNIPDFYNDFAPNPEMYIFNTEGNISLYTSPVKEIPGFLNEYFGKNRRETERSIPFLSESLGFYWNGNEWILDERSKFENNIRNNSTGEFRSNFINEEWVDNIQYQKKYDRHNRISEIILKKWKDNKWINLERYNFVFDENNNNTETIHLKWNKNHWENNCRYISTYNKNNQIKENYKYSWNGKTWLNNNYIIHKYDSKNELSEIINNVFSKDTWIPKDKRIFSYSNREIEILKMQYENNEWINTEKQIYNRAISGLLETCEYKWKNKEWNNFHKSQYQYNRQGLLITSVEVKAENNNWENNLKTIRIYNEKGACLEKTQKIWKNGEWADSRKTYYKYDEQPEKSFAQNEPEPSDFDISQNMESSSESNPVIQYYLPDENYVSLKVFNVYGMETNQIINDNQNAGLYSYEWDGDKMPGGVYYYKLQIGNHLSTNKLISFR